MHALPVELLFFSLLTQYSVQVKNMAEYMVAADVLVSKAGPGTIGKPTVQRLFLYNFYMNSANYPPPPDS